MLFETHHNQYGSITLYLYYSLAPLVIYTYIITYLSIYVWVDLVYERASKITIMGINISKYKQLGWSSETRRNWA